MEISVNQVLYTRDGRRTGNVIVTKIGLVFCEAKSDYGNILRLSANEIEEMFFVENTEGEAVIDPTHKNAINERLPSPSPCVGFPFGSMLTIALFLISSFCSFAAPRCDTPQTPDFSKFPPHVCEYLTANYWNAKRVEHLFGVPASVTLGVSCLETGYGKSSLFKIKNAGFGIKRSKRRNIKGFDNKFRAYDNVKESFDDFGRLMLSVRYVSIMHTENVVSFKTWANELHKRGYCSTKGYNKKLLRVIKYINRNGKI